MKLRVTNEQEAVATLGRDYVSEHTLIVRMPMKLVNDSNGSRGITPGAMHARRKRIESQRNTTAICVRVAMLRWKVTPSDRFGVWLVRVSPRKFDEWENLRNAFKAVKDGIADALGRKNDEDGVITWNPPTQAYGGPKVNEVYIVIERKE